MTTLEPASPASEPAIFTIRSRGDVAGVRDDAAAALAAGQCVNVFVRSGSAACLVFRAERHPWRGFVVRERGGRVKGARHLAVKAIEDGLAYVDDAFDAIRPSSLIQV